ncbi:hypothetical protein MNBD_NITROSPINAE01-258 [hydrothermal vent metagenome]|uniref:SprT-like domain-containing protein n=1 Tax=hydrothermal vent metagenome TaxID=652676 RepID=A0A3B1CNH2_9ZZZZ
MSLSPDLFENAISNTLYREVGHGLKLTFTNNRKSLISIKRQAGLVYVRLSRIFLLADENTVYDIVRFIKGETLRVPRTVMEFAEKSTLPPHVAQKVLSRTNPVGKVYNLRKIAKSVNARYFNGELNINITWGEKPRRKKRRYGNRMIQLGLYDRDLDLVRVHPVLDSETVPVEYLGLVVYHELLHKKLGSKRGANGERRHHGAEFRCLEKEYEQYSWAMAWEKRNINKLLNLRHKLA